MQTLKLTKKYEKYPEYKDSGVEWLGKIPKEWQVGKVKEAFNLLKERSFDNSESDVLSLTLSGIKTRDVSNNEGQIAASYEGYRKIIKGDIVLNPMDLVRGFVDSSKFEGIISPAYSTLRKKNKETDSQFYNYFFQKHYFEGIFHPFGNGVSVDHRWTLKDDTLINFPLVLVPTDEQRKIAKYLDEKTSSIDQIIEKKQKLIEFLREKRTAVINHSVTKGLDPKVELVESGVDWIGKIPKGWKIDKVKRVSDVLPSNVDKLTVEGELLVRLCNYTDVYKNRIIVENMIESLMLATATEKQIQKLSLKKDDVIITKDSETPDDIGIPAYIPETLDGVVCGYHLAIIRPTKIYGAFLNYFFLTQAAKTQFFMAANGLTRYALGVGDISSTILPVPTKKEQEEIVIYLNEKTNQYDKAINLAEESIEKLQEFKSSLISNMVTGKIKI